MKNLYYAQFALSFCVKVGKHYTYLDRGVKWQILTLAIVKKRNSLRCPKLW